MPHQKLVQSDSCARDHCFNSAIETRIFHSAIHQIGISMTFRGNTEIYGENEPAEYLYKVSSGAIRTFKVLSDGRRQIGAFYLPGDIFGQEVGNEHKSSAEAVVDSNIVAINRGALAALAARDGRIARQFWALTATELQCVQNHLTLLIMTAQERVSGFILEMAKHSRDGLEIELPMSRQDIADYLGLTIETVCRTLKQMERCSIIALPNSRHIVLRNRVALGRLDA